MKSAPSLLDSSYGFVVAAVAGLMMTNHDESPIRRPDGGDEGGSRRDKSRRREVVRLVGADDWADRSVIAPTRRFADVTELQARGEGWVVVVQLDVATASKEYPSSKIVTQASTTSGSKRIPDCARTRSSAWSGARPRR